MELSKITVNLTPKSVTALKQAVELNEETKTTVVNRAIQLYDFITMKMAENNEVLLRAPDGNVQIVTFL